MLVQNCPFFVGVKNKVCNRCIDVCNGCTLYFFCRKKCSKIAVQNRPMVGKNNDLKTQF